MRTSDLRAQRLGNVEPSAANERESHAQRVRARGEAFFCGKVKRNKKELMKPKR
jgi:hypothetical protein